MLKYVADVLEIRSSLEKARWVLKQLCRPRGGLLFDHEEGVFKILAS